MPAVSSAKASQNEAPTGRLGRVLSGHPPNCRNSREGRPHQRHAEHTIVTNARRCSGNLRSTSTFMWVPVVRHKRPAPASLYALSPTLGLEAHEWHLLFSWTDRCGPSRHLCPGALVKNVSSNPMACTSGKTAGRPCVHRRTTGGSGYQSPPEAHLASCGRWRCPKRSRSGR
jgi:hypothetical protein